ncbi:MAG: hypothetical protein H6636_06055 [Anaerolineales bacterium]|nr:hypothetical protein [Anaerolineales bacterium]
MNAILSVFFVVYETGDNTTVAEGEAVPSICSIAGHIPTATTTIMWNGITKTRAKWNCAGIGWKIKR